MSAVTRAAVWALVLLSTTTCCGRVSVDVGGSPGAERAGKPLKALNSFREIADAWRYAVDEIRPEHERAIGQATTIALVSRSGGLVEDEPLNDYVNRVGNHVALQGSRKRAPSRRFYFLILDEPVPTAYSIPGGHVLVTRGLLDQLTSESELAFVVAHEIAHVDLEHGLGALKTSAAIPAAALEAIRQLKKHQEGDTWTERLWTNPATFDGVADELIDVAFSKVDFMKQGQEREADELGLRYLQKAGYDSRGAVRVLEMLAASPTSGAARTHEPARTRLERLRSLVKPNDGSTGVRRWNERAVPRLAALAP